jgi:hypothetical protein
MVQSGVPQAWTHHSVRAVHLIRVKQARCASFTLDS